jgi:hypothetical protein
MVASAARVIIQALGSASAPATSANAISEALCAASAEWWASKAVSGCLRASIGMLTVSKDLIRLTDLYYSDRQYFYTHYELYLNQPRTCLAGLLGSFFTPAEVPCARGR